MKLFLSLTCTFSLFLAGCATPPAATPETKAEHKKIIQSVKDAAKELGYGSDYETDQYWEVINTTQLVSKPHQNNHGKTAEDLQKQTKRFYTFRFGNLGEKGFNLTTSLKERRLIWASNGTLSVARTLMKDDWSKNWRTESGDDLKLINLARTKLGRTTCDNLDSFYCEKSAQ